MQEPLWTPSAERIAAAQLTAFARGIEADHGVRVGDYATLHAWSVERPEAFWSAVWRFADVVGDGPGPVLGAGAGRRPGAEWFP